MDLFLSLGITGTVAVLAIYLYIRSIATSTETKVKSEVQQEKLTDIIEKQNAQIKILSDRTPTDIKQLLRDGEF